MLRPASETYGYDEALWLEAKEQTRAILTGVAKRPEDGKCWLTYKELTEKITVIKFHWHYGPLRMLLDQISRESEAEGKGMLSALVINAKDMHPGRGFFDLADALGRVYTSKEQCWLDEFHRVRAAYAAS